MPIRTAAFSVASCGHPPHFAEHARPCAPFTSYITGSVTIPSAATASVAVSGSSIHPSTRDSQSGGRCILAFCSHASPNRLSTVRRSCIMVTTLQPTALPRVLVVDDEPHVRRVTVRSLERHGIECLQAGTAAQGMSLMEQHHADVVVTDMCMPEMNGLDLLRTLRSQAPDTQVLILTGYTSIDTAVTALTQGAFGYLTKPTDPDALYHHVCQAFERRQLLVERRNYTRHLEETVQRKTAELNQMHEEMSLRLVRACCYRDNETGAHIRRVGLLSAKLAAALGWSPEMVERIRSAAPLHDIGKTAIPDAILTKPDSLTDDEYSIMKTHTTLGAELLKGARSPVLAMAHDIALAHHERWNGTGYPCRKQGNDIPEAARIVSVADVFDALAHDRIYRPAFPPAEVLHLLKQGNGTDFEPRILEVFLDCLPQMYAIAEQNPDDRDAGQQGLASDEITELLQQAEHAEA